jgi:hypothetical protein
MPEVGKVTLVTAVPVRIKNPPAEKQPKNSSSGVC